MKTQAEWVQYYSQVGIETESYQDFETQEEIGLKAQIGDNSVRAFIFRNLDDHSLYYRQVIKEQVLSCLHLAKDYAWSVETSATLSVIFRCDYNGKAFNAMPLLWNGSIVIPSLHPNIRFTGELPTYKPMFVDFEVVRDCFSRLQEIMDFYKECTNKEIIGTTEFEESYSLEDFMQVHGYTTMAIGYYTMRPNSISYLRCRVGNYGETYQYLYISSHMREVSAQSLKGRIKNLRVGKTASGEYVLYDTGHHEIWQQII